ncbi:pectin acetylesterase 11-like [Solanum dulcamara]|uniref:pectin acetylesterase 11-like n=1 Tax=Solanum dulcamara TaxID=45834 RepID=UPI0024868141|nr:pectin acetylesterase 11-like [Solanum dulcamara]
MWELWKRRNGIKHGHRKTNSSVIYLVLSSIQRLVLHRNPSIRTVPADWKNLIQMLEGGKARVKVTTVRWKLPPSGWYACNTDGASRGNPGRSAYGFCVRDAEGNLIYAKAEEIGYATNVEAETVALLEAIKYYKQQGLNKIIFQTDSQTIQKIMNGEWKPSWNIAGWVEEVEEYKRDLEVSFKHTLRKANKLADALANYALDEGPLQSYLFGETKKFLLALIALLCTTRDVLGDEDYLYINITVLHSATAQGAVCLDGSPPAYHLDRGHGTGLRSWIIYMEGGGWCSSISDCLDRSTKFLGSTKKMNQKGFFGGILHNTSKENPEFHNWNRVRVKYCDGSSFTGDVEQVHPENKLYFRGARIFKAIMEDLWSKGMKNAENAILSGSSAGGLATILNCDKFKSFLPESARVKCVANAGFFINGKTIDGTSHIQEMYQSIVNLHESAKNLPSACTSAMEPSLCFFPQNVVSYIQTPLFIINSVYDSWQINNTLVSPYLDPQHAWKGCIKNISSCTSSQRTMIQAFGVEFLKIFEGLPPCSTRGYFLTSCYSHGDILSTSYWFNTTSPRLLSKTIAEAVGDWYFERAGFQHIDLYPYVRKCK